jgi:hypothetical protein
MGHEVDAWAACMAAKPRPTIGGAATATASAVARATAAESLADRSAASPWGLDDSATGASSARPHARHLPGGRAGDHDLGHDAHDPGHQTRRAAEEA